MTYETIKVLTECINAEACINCEVTDCYGTQDVLERAIDCIKCQQAEIEKLQQYNEWMSTLLVKRIREFQSEAVNEFAIKIIDTLENEKFKAGVRVVWKEALDRAIEIIKEGGE